MVHTHIEWRQVVTAYPCDTCHAAPGEPCITWSGHPKYEPHAERSRLASAHHWRNPEDYEGEH